MEEKRYYDLQTSILEQADDFFEAYRRCIEGKNPRVDKYNRICTSSVNIPAIVNAAFACELYLKSIVGKDLALREMRIHELDSLYDMIEPKEKEAIKKEVDKHLNHEFYERTIEGALKRYQWYLLIGAIFFKRSIVKLFMAIILMSFFIILMLFFLYSLMKHIKKTISKCSFSLISKCYFEIFYIKLIIL